MQTEVLVVGAGPTGLVLALWLAKQGVAVRIVDRLAEAGTTSRAIAVQARTLELYRQLDLTDAVLAKGHRTPAANLWTEGKRRARISLASIGEDLTPYAFLEAFAQDDHERLLIARLGLLGITVERRLELLDFEDLGNHVRARLRRADGTEEICETAYIAGCDGASSAVRHRLGLSFPGGTYRQVFYVADIIGAGEPLDGELHLDLDEADFLAIFPLSNDGRARLIGTVRDERADVAESLTFEDVSRRAIENLKLEVKAVHWFSTYHVHHRVTDRFRVGRAFVLGDAAHIHSPAGGQGMNTGIGDAINLAWKIAAVLRGKGPDDLLDSFDTERRAFANRLVASTDRAFTFATADGWMADLIRTRIAPVVIPNALKVEAVRDFAFRTVSQITLNYRDMPLSEGKAGEVEGGDRLPWAKGCDNYGTLSRIGWQAHVYGEASPGLKEVCEARGLPLTVFDWDEAFDHARLTRGAVYVLRPDTYIGLIDPAGSAQTMVAYFDRRSLQP